jgi:hypothetical protein
VASAETARLVAELTLKDKLSAGVKSATKSVDGLDKRLGRIGQTAASGARTAGKAMIGLGAIAAGAIALNVKSGIESLATLETAVTSVDGAISQMGQTGQVTGAQVAAWANGIEASIGAAFDDKAITAATSTLIRFGKVTPANLRPAMEVMTDLAAKTGSVDSAATLLAKALADPTKAAGKLARQGVVLTKGEQKQIAAFMKANKIADAQRVILDSLARTTKGAAAASQGPYARAMATMKDATEDAQRALAEGFLPVIERGATWLKTKLADPAVLAKIRTFGTGLAGAFDKAVTFAERLPWGKITAGLEKAAGFAGSLIDAFSKLPPEAMAAILALGGLDKLSGGAVSSIVGELGKGLIKGVLGITAAVVNVNGGVVNGGGGGLPVAGAAGAAGVGVVSVAIAAASIAALGAAVTAGMLYAVPKLLGANIGHDTRPIPVTGSSGQNFGTLTGWNAGFVRALGPLGNAIDAVQAKTAEVTPAIQAMRDEQAKRLTDIETATGGVELATVRGAATATRATENAGRSTTMATYAGAGIVAGAVRASRPIVTTNVTVNVSAASVSKSVSVQARYGSGNGSAGSGPGGAPADIW